MQKYGKYYLPEEKYDVIIHESLCDYKDFIENSWEEKTKGLSKIKITLYDRFGYRIVTIGKGYGVQKIKNSQKYSINVDEKGIVIQFIDKKYLITAFNALYDTFEIVNGKVVVPFGIFEEGI